MDSSNYTISLFWDTFASVFNRNDDNLRLLSNGVDYNHRINSLLKFNNILLILFVLASIVLLILRILSAQKYKIIKFKKHDCAKKKIPLVSHFPVRFPNFIEGIYTLYRLHKDGNKLAERLQSQYGNIFEIPVGTKTIIAVVEPNIVQTILSSSSPQHLNKPKQIYSTVVPKPLLDGLVGSDYKLWSVHRKLLSRCFTYNSLQTYLPYMNEHGKSLINELKSLCMSGNDHSVQGKQIYESIWSASFKIILETMNGKDILQDDGFRKMQHAIKRTKAILQYRLTHPYLLVNLLWNMHPLKKEADELLGFFYTCGQMTIDKSLKIRASEVDKLTGETMEIAKRNNEEDIGIRPFRSIMEQLLDSGISHKKILDEVVTFSATGNDTSYEGISLTLFHLACNKDIQDKCREEVDSLMISTREGENLTMDDLGKLKYLERCILEGMRLTAVVPFFMRQLEAPLKVDEDLVLDGGVTVIFSPWCMHRDKKSFPNPEKFDPDRFLPENVKKRHSFSYLPFSSGQRNCIGYKFAMMEMKIILALLIRHFEVFTTDKPEDISYSFEITLLPDRDINLILKNRNLKC